LIVQQGYAAVHRLLSPSTQINRPAIADRVNQNDHEGTWHLQARYWIFESDLNGLTLFEANAFSPSCV
jgi:hypothetical protein